jgi:hypothetical protein
MYAQRVVEMLGPMTLPYHLGTPASFDYSGINGRPLTDDVTAVMLMLVTKSARGDGVAPDRRLVSSQFPYVVTPLPEGG